MTTTLPGYAKRLGMFRVLRWIFLVLGAVTLAFGVFVLVTEHSAIFVATGVIDVALGLLFLTNAMVFFRTVSTIRMRLDLERPGSSAAPEH
jgi:uncharacterized membrane protein HdeD (DUF308 family)